MANSDRPRGFVPVKTLSGRPWNGTFQMYDRGDSSSDTTNNHGDIYPGDPVKLSSGKVIPANSGDTVLGVAVAVGATAMHGKATYVDASSPAQRNYSPHTNTTDKIGVVLANDMLFEAQTATALSLVPGDAADFSTDATEAHGDRTAQASTAEIVTNSNGDIVVVDTPDYEDGNDSTLANARHLVRFTTIAYPQ